MPIDDQPQLPASPGPPGTWRQLWAVVALAVVVVPNVMAIALPFEAFPWTSAPMFAHSPVAHDRFNLTFTMVDGAGTKTPLPEDKVAGLNPWHFRRNFLIVAWGSDADNTPFGVFANDTPQARQQRLERYFNALERHTKALRRRNFQGQRRIEVARTQRRNDDRDVRDAEATGPTVDMGFYDLQTHRYVLPEATPMAQP